MPEKAKAVPTTVRYQGGLESILQPAGLVFLVFSVGVAVVLVCLNRYLVFISLASAGAGLFGFLVLRALAESIRIQKKSSGLPFSGTITAAKPVIIHHCSSCGAALSDLARCDSCGKEIDPIPVGNAN